ncbi:MAG: TSUP family transporter [Gallionella sp.]|nr:TSUP family transporter [Gallionella sp.]
MFKLGLVGRHANRRVLLRFGIPAIVFSFLGAWLLLQLFGMGPLIAYTAFGRQLQVFPVNLVVGLMLLTFVLAELLPRLREVSFGQKFLPLGGALSGFFGGLSGMQGALRSAFLVKAGLSKEAFVATGVVIACLIDISRLGVYAKLVIADSSRLDYLLLSAAVLSAFAGAFLGNRYLNKLTMHGIQTVVAIMLSLVAVGLIVGLL